MRYITTQLRGRALWITFDRQEKLNILHAEDLGELRNVIAGLAPGARAIVFTRGLSKVRNSRWTRPPKATTRT
jgi:enoyl-CoA hydratase/carnithine racemase